MCSAMIRLPEIRCALCSCVVMLFIGVLLPAGAACADILGVRIGGGLGPDGELRPEIATGGDVYVEIRCAPAQTVHVDLTISWDRNRDGVVQSDEAQQMATVSLQDNGRPGSAVDLNSQRGKIVARLHALPRRQGVITLKAQAADRTSRKAAALRLVIPPGGEAWWRKFDLLLHIEPKIRAPSEEETRICASSAQGGPVQLLDGRGKLSHPRLSHDESRIAYVEKVGGEPRIVLADARRGEVIRTVPGGDWPVWLPQDRGLAFVRNGVLVFLGLDDWRERERPLDFPPQRILPIRSPKAETFALVAVARDASVDEPYRLEIDRSTLAIRRVDRLHLGSDWDDELVSPDGGRFALATDADELYVHSPNRKEGTRLAAAFRVYDPSWSPSGQSLVFVCVPR